MWLEKIVFTQFDYSLNLTFQVFLFLWRPCIVKLLSYHSFNPIPHGLFYVLWFHGGAGGRGEAKKYPPSLISDRNESPQYVIFKSVKFFNLVLIFFAYVSIFYAILTKILSKYVPIWNTSFWRTKHAREFYDPSF